MKKVFLVGLIFSVSLIVFLWGGYGIKKFSIFEEPELKVTFAFIFLISSIPLGLSASRLVGIVLDRHVPETHQAQADHEIEWALGADQTKSSSNQREWYHEPMNQRLAQIAGQPEDPSIPSTG